MGQTIEAVNQNANIAEKAVQAFFREIRASVDEREAEVFGEIEQTRHHKEKELRLQKEDLEFAHFGVISSTKFAQILLSEGTMVEIAMSTIPVTAHLRTLHSTPYQIAPVYSPTIDFSGTGAQETKATIKAFGRVVTHDISAETSFIEAVDCASVLLTNQSMSVRFVALSDKDERIIGEKNTTVILEGPSKAKVTTIL